jgi:hypothetical protein
LGAEGKYKSRETIIATGDRWSACQSFKNKVGFDGATTAAGAALMNPRDHRQFKIFDGMAMTAAIAVGLGLVRLTSESSPLATSLPWKISEGSWALALPVTWMLAGLRLSAPHPRFRAPGAAACLAVTVASLCMLLFFSHNLVSNLPRVGWSSRTFWGVTAQHVLTPMPLAASVAAAWSLLAFDREWRPEASWIDRAGRVVGLYWLVAGLAIPALNIWQN